MAAHAYVEEVSLAGIRAARDRSGRRQICVKRLSRYHGDKVDAVFSGWADTWLRADFRDWSMLERLPAITCPLAGDAGAR